MKFIKVLTVIFFISVCNKTNLPPSLLGNESPEPRYQVLKRKPTCIKAKPDYVLLDTMPAPSKSSAGWWKIIPTTKNTFTLKKQPALFLAGPLLREGLNSSTALKLKGRYVYAGAPQKIKSTQPASKEDAINNIKYFGIDQGLPGMQVQALLKDRFGRLWLGTDNGLSMYDGTSFYNYSVNEGLSSNFISCLSEDEHGRLWIGTKGGGINVFDGNVFIHYSMDEGFCCNDIHVLRKARDNEMWIGTANGLVLCKGGNFRRYTTMNGLNNNTILSLLQDHEKRLWIGTQEGINIFDETGFSSFSKDKIIGKTPIQSLAEDAKGHIWIGNSSGAFEYDGKYFKSYSEDTSSLNKSVQAIICSANNNIWIGTSDGVIKLDENESTYYTTREGLSNNSVTSLLLDDQGQLWMGTKGGGANLIGDFGFTHYYSKGELNFVTRALLEDNKKRIWIGTDKSGVIMFDRMNFHVLNSKTGLNSDAISSLVEDENGNIWIGTFSDGINLYNGKTIIHYTTKQGLSDNHVNCMLRDRSGKMWIGTNSGVNIFDGKRFTHYTAERGLTSNSINALFEDEVGNVWIGTFGGGINFFCIKNNNFIHYTQHEGLSNNVVTGFAGDKLGRVWIGTLGGGLCLFDGKGFTNFTTEQGLCDNNISSIVKDSSDFMWVGTGKGLNCLSGNNDSLFTILNYKKRQGLCHLEFNKSALCDSRRKLWWGTGDVLTCYDPITSVDPSFPLTQVTELDVMGKPVKWVTSQITNAQIGSDVDTVWSSVGDTFFLAQKDISDTGCFEISGMNYTGVTEPYYLPQNLSLPYDKNWLTFHFTGIRFKDIETLKYRYMLEGFDDKLNPITELNEADYRNLPPGKYSFKVYGRCRNAIWSLASELSFEIRKPWWQTIFAYVSYIASVILIVYGFIRWRTSKLRKSKRLLELTVAQRTAEITRQNEELERLSIVASETDNIIIILGADGKIEWVNSSFERVCGISLEEITLSKGETIFDISNNPDIRQIIRESISEKKSISFEALHRRRDGGLVWLSSMLTPIFGESGNLKKLIIIDTDITERKSAEQMIRQKNIDITDSITYAKRIQQAILPEAEEILNVFPQSFVLFNPRDIVSGDFYWFSESANSIILAVADCTGHGVPGAFMSMIGNSLLQKIVSDKKITNPAIILKTLDQEVVKALKQNREGESKDGMDIALLEINRQQKTFTFSGANRPLYLIRNGEFTEISGNKFPIGSYLINEKDFINHTQPVKEGDIFYILSDGYADQFGGKKQKKFKTRRLKEILMTIHNKSMEEQKQMLYDTINEWRGETYQVDDILIIGIRISSDFFTTESFQVSASSHVRQAQSQII